MGSSGTSESVVLVPRQGGGGGGAGTWQSQSRNLTVSHLGSTHSALWGQSPSKKTQFVELALAAVEAGAHAWSLKRWRASPCAAMLSCSGTD